MDKIKEINGIKKKIVTNYILHIALMIPLIYLFFACLIRVSSSSVYIVFLLLTTALFFVVMFIFTYTKKDLANVFEKTKRFYELSEKYGFPLGGINNIIGDVCYNSFITYRCESGAGILKDKAFLYFWKKDDLYYFLELPKENLISVPERDLISYTVTGDIDYVTKIAGGGGGGSSIGGAVVGGLLGGTTGAVIGSRKEVQPITTSITKMDNQNTIINAIIGEKIVYLVFTGGRMYDELIKLSPSKEMSILTQTVTIQEMNTFDVASRLKKLDELLERELISQEEYQEKRKEILLEI